MALPRKIEGLSLPINVSLILINLISLFFVLFSFRNGFQQMDFLSLIFGGVFFFFSLSGIFVFKGKQLFAHLTRWIVGSLFLFSALLKLSDHFGFANYLAELFSDDVASTGMKALFSMEQFSANWMYEKNEFISSFVILIQLAFGTLLIIGGLPKLTSVIVLLLVALSSFFVMNKAVVSHKKGYWKKYTLPSNSLEARQFLKKAENKRNCIVLHFGKTHLKGKEWTVVKESRNTLPSLKAIEKVSNWKLSSRHFFLMHLFFLYLSSVFFWASNRHRANTISDNWRILPLAFAFALTFSLFVNQWWLSLFFLGIILLALWIYRSWGKNLGNHFSSLLVLLAFGFLLLKMPRYVGLQKLKEIQKVTIKKK